MNFTTSGLRARNLESAGASAQDSLDSEHSHPGLRVDSLIFQGLLSKTNSRKGIGTSEPRDQDLRAQKQRLKGYASDRTRATGS
jgi:hypothetical protein